MQPQPGGHFSGSSGRQPLDATPESRDTLRVTDTLTPADVTPRTAAQPALRSAEALDEECHDWTLDEVTALFELPLTDLLWRAQSTHRRHREPDAVQLSTLLSIKTGACPEDCAYCPQAAQYNTGLTPEPLMGTSSGWWLRPNCQGGRGPNGSAWGPRGARPRTGDIARGRRDDRGCQGPGAGDVYDPGHAHRRPR
jgi:hypothetical protein